MIKRKIVIIDKVLQFRYAGVIIASMILVIGLIWSLAFYYIHSHKDLLDALPGSEAIVFSFAKYLLAVMLFFVVFVSVYSIFVSHKFAGPIYRFKKTLEELATGDLTARAFLRERDELNDVRETLNAAIKSIHTRMKQDKSKIKDVVVILKQINVEISQPLSQEKLKDVTAKLAKIESTLHEIGNQFKM